jgi:hypothetical protein
MIDSAMGCACHFSAELAIMQMELMNAPGTRSRSVQ